MLKERLQKDKGEGKGQGMKGLRKREKERCSGSFHLAVGFLVIKDDSVSGEGLMVMKGNSSKRTNPSKGATINSGFKGLSMCLHMMCR